MNQSTTTSAHDRSIAAQSAWLLLGCCLGLLAVGVMTAASVAPPGEFASKMKSHGASVAVAMLGFLVALKTPISLWRRAAPWILGAVLVALAVVLVPGVGQKVKGGRRWLELLGQRFQPSEFAKVALILFLADFIGKAPERLTDLWRGYCCAAGVVLLTAGAVFFEPDLGTTLYLVAIGGVMLAVGTAPTMYLIGSGVVAIPLVLGLGYLRYDHAKTRSTNDYQVVQSLRALGEGGPFGVGYGAGRMKLGHVPEGHNDFILAAVGEEWGLIGTTVVLLLFAGIVVAGARAVSAVRDPFARLIVFAVPFAIVFQAAVNLFVVTGLVYPKGIALPFVSSGGSCLLAFSVAVGLAANVLREQAQRSADERSTFASLLSASSDPQASPA
ncbi:MAG: FtsW/RodA/SpoVE family cell cycle protein [Planctomycetes bacterium]|nr:FtsW/RodA/SpoVE family cell cycle protein [Planctomycetota bacterium]